MRQKRRSRNYRHPSGRKAKLNFAPVIVILCLSVGCGYATAKYVVDPVVNYVPQLTAEKNQKESDAAKETETKQQESGDTGGSSAVVEDDVTVKETGEIAGYALQFGCYSSKSAAETVMPTLGMSNLQIIEQNDMYKIVGETYKTKAEAKKALQELPETANAFVATIYK